MRMAFAKAGLWFFGTMIFVAVFFGSYLKGKSSTEQLASLAIAGLLVGGTVFFNTLYEHEKEEHELKIAERRNALKAVDRSPDKTA